MYVYTVVTVATAVAAWLLTPVCGRLATRLGVVDKPDVRKVHKTPVPYFGGVAIFLALIIGGVASLLLARDAADTLARTDTRLYTLLGASALIFATGLADDVRHIRARHKLALQALAASSVCAAGIRLDSISLIGGHTVDLGILTWPVTILWIIGLTNAINLIDGLDGLATGIASIACAALGFTVWKHIGTPGTPPQLALLCGLLGALLGFLPHNHRPAKIFLGDAGSLLIGFLISTLSLASHAKSATLAGIAVPTIAVAALGIPIFDTIFAMLRRFIERRGIMSPDRNHIHHRLLSRGLTHQTTVYLLWAETAIITALALTAGALSIPPIAQLGLAASTIALHVVFFRHIGAIRLRDSYRAVRRVANQAAAHGAQKRAYDELDLHFAGTHDQDTWWRAVTLGAHQLGFTRIHLTWPKHTGAATDMHWSTPDPEHNAPSMRTRIPISRTTADTTAAIEIHLPARSLESAGHRIMLFGRLLDRHPLTEVQGRAANINTKEIPRPETATISSVTE